MLCADGVHRTGTRVIFWIIMVDIGRFSHGPSRNHSYRTGKSTTGLMQMQCNITLETAVERSTPLTHWVYIPMPPSGSPYKHPEPPVLS